MLQQLFVAGVLDWPLNAKRAAEHGLGRQLQAGTQGHGSSQIARQFLKSLRMRKGWCDFSPMLRAGGTLPAMPAMAVVPQHKYSPSAVVTFCKHSPCNLAKLLLPSCCCPCLQALSELGYRLEDLYEEEQDAALGNGGMRRLGVRVCSPTVCGYCDNSVLHENDWRCRGRDSLRGDLAGVTRARQAPVLLFEAHAHALLW